MKVNIFKYKKINIEKYLFSCIFFSELFLLLLPAWSLSPLWKVIAPENYFSVILNGSQILFFLFSIVILCIKPVPKNILIWCIILELFFLTSLVVTNFKSGLFAVVAVPVSFCALFGILKSFPIPNGILKKAFYIMLFWCIIPVIILPIVPYNVRLSFFISDTGQLLTFGGFALHRNFYGMVLGAVIILLFIPQLHISKVLKVIYLILCLIALFLCASRSVMVSVGVVLVYMFFFKDLTTFIKRLPILILTILGSITLYGIYTTYSIRPEKTNDDRYELYYGFFDEILKHPFFGKGETFLYFSKGYPEGSVAHNFILQLSADYGIIFCCCFLLFLCYILCISQFYSRLFIIYTIIWGLFQPYFSYGIPGTQILIPLLIGFILDKQNENSLLYSRSL